MYEWRARASSPDNHFFDCLVGCAVGASIGGISLDEASTYRRARKKSLSLEELARAAKNKNACRVGG